MKRYKKGNKFYTEGDAMTYRISETEVFSGVPTEEQLIEWGYEEYVEPEPEEWDEENMPEDIIEEEITE